MKTYLLLKNGWCMVCRVGLVALALVGVGVVHATPVEIQVWHALPLANKDEFEKLVKQYNNDQNAVAVKLRAFASESGLAIEARSALQSKQGPNLMQLADNHSPEVVEDAKSILPLHQLLAKYPIKDLHWYLPQTSSFVRDDRNRLLAFPWMAEVPVMFYNTDYYKKTGLNPLKPARTWADLQAELIALRETYSCPYASSDQVSVHLENLAAVNNQLYVSNANGLTTAGKKAPPAALQFDTLFMRHMSLMVAWKRSLLFTGHTGDATADSLFANGECAVLTASSGAFGEFAKAQRLAFGVAPLPFYPQATKEPGLPFVSGSAFWAADGKPPAEQKATAAFLGWLSTPVVATKWHQHTGYLPLTEAAFRASDVSFYDKYPGAHNLIASMSGQPGPNGRGFRMQNYENILPVLNREVDDALEGKKAPVAALSAAAEAAKSLSQKK
jgi:multiple sugar transport system substrate-binding protein